MVAGAPTVPREPRLNPFVFPSDTDLRFVLLVVSVLGASLFVYNWLYYDLFSSEFLDATRRCQASAQAAYPDADPTADPSGAFNQRAAQTQAFERCLEPAERAQFFWIISGVALLLVVAAAIYRVMPALKIRRDGLVPLTDERAPGVWAYLDELCREAGLSRLPTLLVNPRNSSASGVVFGHRGRRYVSLNVGLVMKFYTDRPTFRAVVLHELAHLRNADVDKTYLSIAVGIAFAAAALLPLAVSLVYYLASSGDPGGPGFALNVAWRVLGLAALVYLTLAAVLRARELYADVRASAWDGPSSALGKVLSTLSPPKGGRLRVLLSLHPDPAERRRTLAETDRLFRMGFWDAFGTGVAAMVAVPILTLVLGLGIPSRLEDWAPTAAALLFAPLAVGVVGLGAWRGTFAALARDEAPQGMGRLGLALGLGLMAGQALSLDAPAVASETTVLFNLALGSLLLIGLPCLVWWISAGARAWLERIGTRHSLRLVALFGLISVGLLSTVVLGSLLWLLTTGPASLGLLALVPVGLLNAVLQSPLTLLVLVGLWAFPLAASLWRGRPASVSAQWAFLDPSPRPLALGRGDSFGLRQTFVTGLVGGLAFSGLLLAAQFWWSSTPETVRDTDQARILFFLGQVTAAALVQAGTAVVVAIRVDRLGGIHGLFGAFVAGCVAAVGILGLNLAFGGSIERSFAWITFTLVLNGGALLSLPAATGAASLASRARSTAGNSRPLNA